MDVARDFPGIEYMGDAVKDKLKSYGQGIRLHPLSKFVFPELIELDDYCRVCDFAFILGGKGVKIGAHTDMQPHCVLWGGGETIIGARVSVGPGSVLLSAVYSHAPGLRMVDGLPEGAAHALYGKCVIQDDVYIGANATIMPITIGEGAIVGAASFVNKDVPPWSIVVGSPARKIGERQKL